MSLIIDFVTFVMKILKFTEKKNPDFWFWNGSLNTCGHIMYHIIVLGSKIIEL